MSQGVTRFRTSFTHTEGNVPAIVVEGKVVNVNLVNWTVDVLSQYDRKKYFDIQVGSPYLHYSNGEGFSAVPEVGAKCKVCIPSDSSPMYVQSFVMPVENVDLATEDAPKGTTSHTSSTRTSSGASFAGGRPKAKPGDIFAFGRDGNFFILHRGGVLQIGSTELSQRIYIPLGHFMMDISQNYAHHNSGGSILWGIQEGPVTENIPAEFTQTFRVYANSKSADVRVRVGKVSDPMPEPAGDNGNQSDIDLLSLGKGDDFIVYEVCLAKDGFSTQTGAPEDSAVKDKVTMRFFFDRAGGMFLRCQSSFLLATKKKLRLLAKDTIDIQTEKDFNLKAQTGAIIDGGAFTHIKGGIVRLGPGSKPVAHQGSLVQITLPFTPVPVPGSPPLVLYATVLTGEPTVLV